MILEVVLKLKTPPEFVRLVLRHSPWCERCMDMFIWSDFDNYSF